MYDIWHTIVMEVNIMISIRMNETAEKELKEIAKFEGLSVSEYVRKIINEKLEDIYDFQIGTKALEEFEKNPVTYTFEEVFKDWICINFYFQNRL